MRRITLDDGSVAVYDGDTFLFVEKRDGQLVAADQSIAADFVRSLAGTLGAEVRRAFTGAGFGAPSAPPADQARAQQLVQLALVGLVGLIVYKALS